MEKECLHFKMVINIKDSGMKAWCMEKVILLGMMVLVIEVYRI
jgi:hypothetical protein